MYYSNGLIYNDFQMLSFWKKKKSPYVSTHRKWKCRKWWGLLLSTWCWECVCGEFSFGVNPILVFMDKTHRTVATCKFTMFYNNVLNILIRWGIWIGFPELGHAAVVFVFEWNVHFIDHLKVFFVVVFLYMKEIVLCHYFMLRLKSPWADTFEQQVGYTTDWSAANPNI